MLLIRDEQMAVFKEYMVKQFENLMVAHLNVYLPKACQVLGEDGVRKEIRYGIDKAKVYGMVIERDISRFINLMFMFGRDFDTDPALTWAGDILNNEDIEMPSGKMDALYEEAEKHVHDDINVHSQSR